MKRLDRAIFRELLVPFLIGTVAVVLMFQVNLLIFQLKTFTVSAVPVEATVQLILYKTPQFLNMTLPVGTSIAASLAFSRLTRESELTALRAAGTPILRVIWPVFVFGMLVAVGNYFLAERVMPRAEREARTIMTQMGLLGNAPEFMSNVTIRLQNYTASFGTVQRTGPGTVQLTEVLLIERPRPDEIWLYSASRGVYEDGVWTLRNVVVRQLVGEVLTLIKPQNPDVVINEPIVVEGLFLSPIPDEKTTAELEEAIRQGRLSGTDTTGSEIALQTRIAVPAACAIFALVAPVFAVFFARTGAFIGVLLSIIIVFAYYNAFVISTEILGRNGWVSPFVSAWLPNFLFLALGLVAIRRLE